MCLRCLARSNPRLSETQEVRGTNSSISRDATSAYLDRPPTPTKAVVYRRLVEATLRSELSSKVGVVSHDAYRAEFSGLCGVGIPNSAGV